MLCGCERWFLVLYPEWDCRPVLLTACVDLQALQQRVSSWAPVLTHLSLFLKSDVLFWKARVHSSVRLERLDERDDLDVLGEFQNL